VNNVRIAYEWDAPNAGPGPYLLCSFRELRDSLEYASCSGLEPRCGAWVYRLNRGHDFHPTRQALASRAGFSWASIFGEDCFYFFVSGNFAAGDGCKGLINSFEFCRRGIIDAMPPRLYFEGDLRKLILVVLGPTFDP
jgi:hypothetical protein